MTAFRYLLRAEWTKLRTVPGWVAGIAVAAFLIVGVGLMPGMRGSCGRSACSLPVGPEGQEVTDSFTFLHRTLTGDGSVTVRVASLTGLMAVPEPGQSKPGLEPWAKAGLIVKDGVRPVDPRDELDEGRLAGAVLADEPVHLAGVQFERHAVKGAHSGELLAHRPHVDGGRGHAGSPLRGDPP